MSKPPQCLLDALAVSLHAIRGDYEAIGHYGRPLSREELFGALGQTALLAAEGAVAKYGSVEAAQEQLQQLLYTLAAIDPREVP